MVAISVSTKLKGVRNQRVRRGGVTRHYPDSSNITHDMSKCNHESLTQTSVIKKKKRRGFIRIERQGVALHIKGRPAKLEPSPRLQRLELFSLFMLYATYIDVCFSLSNDTPFACFNRLQDFSNFQMYGNTVVVFLKRVYWP